MVRVVLVHRRGDHEVWRRVAFFQVTPSVGDEVEVGGLPTFAGFTDAEIFIVTKVRFRAHDTPGSICSTLVFLREREAGGGLGED